MPPPPVLRLLVITFVIISTSLVSALSPKTENNENIPAPEQRHLFTEMPPYYWRDKLKLKHFTFRIVESRPHATDFFTQGFTFRDADGLLMESTGIVGKSRVVVYDDTLENILLDSSSSPTPEEEEKDDRSPTIGGNAGGNHRKQHVSGATSKSSSLPDSAPHNNNDLRRHFGEGITDYRGKIYQLTWKDNKVHIYDSRTLRRLEVREMPKEMSEGWGLTASPDLSSLVMGEGSAKLYFVTPDSGTNAATTTALKGFTLVRELIVRDCLSPDMHSFVGGLNELETVPLNVSHPEALQWIHPQEAILPLFEERERREGGKGLRAIEALPGALLWCVLVFFVLSCVISG